MQDLTPKERQREWQARGGTKTIARYGANVVAGRARAGKEARYRAEATADGCSDPIEIAARLRYYAHRHALLMAEGRRRARARRAKEAQVRDETE